MLEAALAGKLGFLKLDEGAVILCWRRTTGSETAEACDGDGLGSCWVSVRGRASAPVVVKASISPDSTRPRFEDWRAGTDDNEVWSGFRLAINP